MKKLKVMTLVGTRPEIIRLCRVIAELEKQTDHVLVHTGQNYDYELNEIFFEDLGLRRPDHFLGAAGANACETIGNILIQMDRLLNEVRPDAFLVLGDTNSALGAIVAKRHKIPIFHMEAGNRCFDQRVPEETNRRIVDHISDINLAYSEHARRYLLREGLPPDMVMKTGSPMYEVLRYYMEKIDAADSVERLGLEPEKYFVVSAHREENVDSEANLTDLLDSLEAMANHWNYPIIVSTHPRTRKRLNEIGLAEDGDTSRAIGAHSESVRYPGILRCCRFLKPLGFCDYVKLQKHAFCTVSDSGTITEESSVLGIPAITIRQAHERPEGMDEGVLIMSGLRPERVMQSIEIVTEQWRKRGIPRVVGDYEQPNVSRNVVRIIMSYTDYVNRNVWRKV
ncbi:MAG: UDP-N-acetylglucosamine 2-epimerase (non-hydrolyzing) [Thermoguttaceae bacterium]|nr:UDP-N-acetylglucosamine 2-epimerase (non-hydrolyzing) [Thermoguttaceae bacterium]